MHVIAFDFDGTLSDSEMTVLLGNEADVADEIADITERAMNDELSYADSLYERVALLDGLSEANVSRAFEQVQLRPGSTDVINALKSEGHHVAILTGGFDEGVRTALDAAGCSVDTIIANRLSMRNGRLTGGVSGPLIEGTKDSELESLADSLDVSMSETIAIGDGANDLPMLQVAAWSIGYNPKPAVEPHCDDVVSSMTALRELFESAGII